MKIRPRNPGELLSDWWMLEPWYVVTNCIFDSSRRWPTKPLRIVGAVLGFMWFMALSPLTFISLLVTLAIDAWELA